MQSILSKLPQTQSRYQAQQTGWFQIQDILPLAHFIQHNPSFVTDFYLLSYYAGLSSTLAYSLIMPIVSKQLC